MVWGNTKTFFHISYQTDYAMAVKTFVSLANNQRRGDPNTRFLKAGVRSEWVRKGDMDEIIFSYGEGNQVTFYRTGELHLSNVYWTGSSTAFVNAVTPRGMEFGTTADDKGTVCLSSDAEHRYYRLSSRYEDVTLVRRDGAWTPKTGFEAFTVPVFDKKAANAALRRSGASDFIAWAKTIVALGGWSPRPRSVEDRGPHLTVKTPSGRNEIMRLLALEDRWMDLLQSPDLTNHARKTDEDKALKCVVESVRRAVYGSTPGVVRFEEHPHIVGGLAFRSYVTARKAYAYVGS